MTPKQEEAIRRHGENIKAIFPAVKDLDAVTLCKKLRRLETKAHRSAEAYCNGKISEEQNDKVEAAVLESLDKLLRFKVNSVPVFVNGDPRGYALKIQDSWVRERGVRIHQDWGGYGILAPEIGKNGN
jgi:hypothetical protein